MLNNEYTDIATSQPSEVRNSVQWQVCDSRNCELWM